MSAARRPTLDKLAFLCRAQLLASAALGGCMSMSPVPPAADLAAVTPDGWRSGPAEWDGRRGTHVEIRSGNGNALLIPVAIDDAAARWFILDSGAGRMLATESTARAALLPAIGTAKLQGEHATTVYRARRVAIGPLTLTEVPLVGMNISNAAIAFGTDVGGICGHELFERGVVEIDLGASTLAIHDPTVAPDEALPWVPISFARRLPAVRCRFPQGDGLLVLDTGFAGGVQFTAHARERAPELATLTGRSRSFHGMGWSERVTESTLEWLEVGGMRFSDVPAAIPAGESRTADILGVGADGDLLGVIGCDVLRRCRVVLDYARSRVAFLPVVPADADAAAPARRGATGSPSPRLRGTAARSRAADRPTSGSCGRRAPGFPAPRHRA